MQRLKGHYEHYEESFSSKTLAASMFDQPVHSRDAAGASLATEVLGLDELRQERPSNGDVKRLLQRLAEIDSINPNILLYPLAHSRISSKTSKVWAVEQQPRPDDKAHPKYRAISLIVARLRRFNGALTFCCSPPQTQPRQTKSVLGQYGGV